uniref:Arsenite methyltransferase n=1 Tax=Octopus bimaculoides TaxID=37653 RepID=A0A0L8G3Q1_OCTBM
MCDKAVYDQVKDYYGKKVKKTTDLKLSACTVSAGTGMSKHAKEALASVHEEVCKKYYGCGLVIPEGLEGMKMLDLGSGSGQDCFVLSKLVGPEGYVVGIDMTQEQLDVANQYIDYHTKLYDYKNPNVKFVKGYIERLTEAGLEENSFDIIISNCVINLSPDKRAVLSQSYKILKMKMQLKGHHFNTVVKIKSESQKFLMNSRLDSKSGRNAGTGVVQGDYFEGDDVKTQVAHKIHYFERGRCQYHLTGLRAGGTYYFSFSQTTIGECISGALYWKDFHELAGDVGFSQARIVSVSPIPVDREDFRKILGDIQFVSVTYRLFKLPPDYQKTPAQAIYNGEITDHENEFKFDHQLTFLTNEPVCIDSETHAILKYSRFKDEFMIRTQKCGTTGEGDSCSAVINPFELLKTLQTSGKTIANACCGGKKCC